MVPLSPRLYICACQAVHGSTQAMHRQQQEQNPTFPKVEFCLSSINPKFGLFLRQLMRLSYVPSIRNSSVGSLFLVSRGLVRLYAGYLVSVIGHSATLGLLCAVSCHIKPNQYRPPTLKPHRAAFVDISIILPFLLHLFVQLVACL